MDNNIVKKITKLHLPDIFNGWSNPHCVWKRNIFLYSHHCHQKLKQFKCVIPTLIVLHQDGIIRLADQFTAENYVPKIHSINSKSSFTLSASVSRHTDSTKIVTLSILNFKTNCKYKPQINLYICENCINISEKNIRHTNIKFMYNKCKIMILILWIIKSIFIHYFPICSLMWNCLTPKGQMFYIENRKIRENNWRDESNVKICLKSQIYIPMPSS